MELEPLFEGLLAFNDDEGAHFAAYGEDGDVVGYVGGTGEITGERLRGTLTWTNTPRRRNDGTWLFDITGLIRTDDGEVIRFETGGYNWSMTDDPFEYAHRQVVGALTFGTPAKNYQWLNTTFALLEGEHGLPHVKEGDWQVRAFAVRPGAVEGKE